MLSTDGPGRNVLKFKPPMCFSLDNVQHVVAKLDAILTGKHKAHRQLAMSLEPNLEPAARTIQRGGGSTAEPGVLWTLQGARRCSEEGSSLFLPVPGELPKHWVGGS